MKCAANLLQRTFEKWGRLPKDTRVRREDTSNFESIIRSVSCLIRALFESSWGHIMSIHCFIF